MGQLQQSSGMLITHARAVVTMDSSLGIVSDGYIFIEDGWIQAVGSMDNLPEHLENTVQTRIDASGKVLLPGLINTHHHFYQTLTRAYPPVMDAPLFQWLRGLYPVWARLDEEAIRLGTVVGMAELLLSGCTTTTDHHYVFPRGIGGELIDIQIEAARELGMRFHPCRGSMNLSQKDGGLPPDSVVQTADEIVQDSERLIRTYHDPTPGAMTRIALAPCSPFSVTTALMKDTAHLAREKQVRLHTHLAETMDEEEFCMHRFDYRPVEYLERVGWMTDATWLAHGIYFSEDEISRLGQAGVGVAHCPGSNMRLGSGVAKIDRLTRAGCPVGLAVDGSASNDASNMLAEVRQALLLARLARGAASMSVLEALELATHGSAACLGRDDIGVLAPGKAADMAMFSLEDVGYSGAGDPVGALVLCQPTRVDTVLVHGRVLVQDGHLVTLDVAPVLEAHRRKSQKIQAS